jgi:hypothetical protein
MSLFSRILILTTYILHYRKRFYGKNMLDMPSNLYTLETIFGVLYASHV